VTKLYLLCSWAVLIPLAVYIWLILLRNIGRCSGVEYVALLMFVAVALMLPLPLHMLFKDFMALPLK
jgi:hypothetical protein